MLCRRRRQPAPLSSTPFPDDGDWSPFTPEAFPGLSPEFCAFLNTPLEECDPEDLRILLAAFAETIVRHLPPESGMTDATELFSSLWSRFSAVLDYVGPDAVPAAAHVTPVEALPAAVPATAAGALPIIAPTPPAEASDTLQAAPVISPDPLPVVSSPALPEALPVAPFVMPPPPPETQAADLSHDAKITVTAAFETAPDAATGPKSVLHAFRPELIRGHLFLYRIESIYRRRVRPFHCWRAPLRRFLVRPLPPRQWYYAARASPV